MNLNSFEPLNVKQAFAYEGWKNNMEVEFDAIDFDTFFQREEDYWK